MLLKCFSCISDRIPVYLSRCSFDIDGKQSSRKKTSWSQPLDQRYDEHISFTRSTSGGRPGQDWRCLYFLVFKGDASIRKMAHHALLVDVAGTTDEFNFCGVLLHLTANASDRQTECRIDDRPWRKNIFYESFYIGKTVPPNHMNMSQPRKWAMALLELASDNFLAESTCDGELIHSRVMTYAINWSTSKATLHGHRNSIVKSL